MSELVERGKDIWNTRGSNPIYIRGLPSTLAAFLKLKACEEKPSDPKASSVFTTS